MSATHTLQAPRWPAEPIDPQTVWVDYYVPADEFLVFFGGEPVPKISDPLVASGFYGVSLMLGLGNDGQETGDIVGIHIIPMLLGAVQDRPQWAVLTWAAMAGDYGTELLKERLPGFLVEVEAAFRQYWTPAPPIEEQMAEIERSRQRREAAGSKTASTADSR